MAAPILETIMREMFNDNGVMREIIKVACPIIEGNDQGFYTQYRDAMRPDEFEYSEKIKTEPEAKVAVKAKGKK